MNITYENEIKRDNSWFWDKNFKANLICTDDLDSLLSVLLILQYRPNWKISGFFDYRTGLYQKLDEDIELTQENTVWVDCSSIKQGDKCISNHLTSISGEVHNTADINLNTIDENNRDKHYFSKYNLSTFLLLVSLFEHEIDNKVGQVLSLCPDSAYKAYYQPSQYADSEVQRQYLVNKLQLKDIYDIQSKITKNKFKQIIRQQNLNSKVYVNEFGIRTVDDVDLEMILKYLNITTDLSVLDGMFGMIEESSCANKSVNVFRGRDLQDSKITSYAITSNNNVSYSYKID